MVAEQPEQEELTLDDQAAIAVFKLRIQSLSLKQCQELAIQMYTTDIRKDKTWKKLLKHKWGLDDTIPRNRD